MARRVSLLILLIFTLWLPMSACATGSSASVAPIESLEEIAPTAPLDLSTPLLAIETSVAKAKRASDDEAVAPTIELARVSAVIALEQTRARLGSTWERLPQTQEYVEILSNWQIPKGAISIGSTSTGKLMGSAALPLDSPHHTIIARARPRGTRWGHPTLITLIRDASKGVAQTFEGSRLAVGNIGYKNGGDIRWSRSHNSGRDADLAFYVKDAQTGERLDAAPDLLEFDDQGRSIGVESDYLFDVERNWALVHALLSHERAQIQFLFISEPLKQMLLSHARTIEAPDEIIARASDALIQPTDALPHNDHFHLRITCDLEDRVRGCIDRGARWEWVDWHDEALLSHTLAMKEAIMSGDSDAAHMALEYVHAIESPFGPEFALTHGVRHEDEEVRAHALEVASRFWTFSGTAHVAMQRLIVSPRTTMGEKEMLYGMMRRTHDPWTIPFATSVLLDDAMPEEERVMAVNALSHHMEPELVPLLIEELTRQPDSVRVEIVMLLRKITNHTMTTGWARLTPDEVSQAQGAWRVWWEAHKGMERHFWVAQGFEEIGVDPQYIEAPWALEVLIDALPHAPEHLVYNINCVLRERTGRWSPLEVTDGEKLHQRWSTWWKKNREAWLASS